MAKLAHTKNDTTGSSHEEEDLDPRIQIELEVLNSCTDEINSLEMQLDEANTLFRLTLNESTAHLKILAKSIGSALEKTRPYFEAKELAYQAQLECQKAAIQFQRAYSIHQAAKETITLAEQRFLSKQNEWDFDSAWQEMLNHATVKVMEAENQRSLCEKLHKKKAAVFTMAEKKVQQLESKLGRSISKARPYFIQKDQFQKELVRQKNHVQQLQNLVCGSKKRYAESLKKLEAISEEIHSKRKLVKHDLQLGNATTFELPDIDLDFCDKVSVCSGKSSSISSAAPSDIDDDIDSISSPTISMPNSNLSSMPGTPAKCVQSDYWQEVRGKIEEMTKSLADGSTCENLNCPELVGSSSDCKYESSSTVPTSLDTSTTSISEVNGYPNHFSNQKIFNSDCQKQTTTVCSPLQSDSTSNLSLGGSIDKQLPKSAL